MNRRSHLHFLANHQEITRKEVQTLLDVGRVHHDLAVEAATAARTSHPSKGLAAGDPAKMAARMIESVAIEPAPLRQVYGSQALTATIERLEKRVADYRTQTVLAASTDYPAGE